MERAIAPSTSGRRSDTGLAKGAPTTVTAIFGSATTPLSCWRISSTATPGKMRQLMVAVAFCGNAFSACPALSMVATQVVRVVPTNSGSAQIASAAALSCGLAAKLLSASPADPEVTLPTAPKYARLRSFDMTGKRYRSEERRVGKEGR